MGLRLKCTLGISMNMLPSRIKTACLTGFCIWILSGCTNNHNNTYSHIEPLKIILLNANKSLENYPACEGFSNDQATTSSLADELAEVIKAMNSAPISLEQNCEATESTNLFCQVSFKSEASELVFSRHYQFMIDPQAKQMNELKCFNLP